jgi:hypothetical protein
VTTKNDPDDYTWYSASGYAGGPPPPHPISQGRCAVSDDGCLQVSPDDDYYCGTVSAVNSKSLALLILKNQGYQVVLHRIVDNEIAVEKT